MFISKGNQRVYFETTGKWLKTAGGSKYKTFCFVFKVAEELQQEEQLILKRSRRCADQSHNFYK